MTPLAQALRRAAPLRPAPRVTDRPLRANQTHAQLTTERLGKGPSAQAQVTDTQVTAEHAEESTPCRAADHDTVATPVLADFPPCDLRRPDSRPSVGPDSPAGEPVVSNSVAGDGESATPTLAAAWGLAAQHLADWQRITQARRVLVLATRPDPRCHRALAALARQLTSLIPTRLQAVAPAVDDSAAGSPHSDSADAPSAMTSHTVSGPPVDWDGQSLTLLDGTACPLVDLAPWFRPGAVDGLLEIRPAQSGPAPPAWECQRLVADIPLVGVVEIRSSTHPGPSRVACT